MGKTAKLRPVRLLSLKKNGRYAQFKLEGDSADQDRMVLLGIDPTWRQFRAMLLRHHMEEGDTPVIDPDWNEKQHDKRIRQLFWED